MGDTAGKFRARAGPDRRIFIMRKREPAMCEPPPPRLRPRCGCLADRDDGWARADIKAPDHVAGLVHVQLSAEKLKPWPIVGDERGAALRGGGDGGGRRAADFVGANGIV